MSSNSQTNIFGGVPEMYKPYQVAFKKGVHLSNARILKAFVVPSAREMWIVLDNIYGMTEYIGKSKEISKDSCVNFMPVIVQPSQFSRVKLPSDAIELEVTQ